jgi:tRNA pseudouridine55 synthase
MNNPSSQFDFEAGEVLLINKPLRWTSFDVVKKIRNASKAKTGHAGTLDHLATGLLIICTGKATKKIEHYMGLEKEYTATFFIGATTPSYDLETPVDNVFDITNINERDILEAAKKFTGELEQLPPVFSAVKQDGKRLYESARLGKEVRVVPRTVMIHSFEITGIALPEVHFKVVCSKGTYIRSLAHDFGIALKSGAYLKTLRRTRIGPYLLDHAWELEPLIKIIREQRE